MKAIEEAEILKQERHRNQDNNSVLSYEKLDYVCEKIKEMFRNE